MKFIQPKVEIIEQEPGIEGIYKQIELAGRTCYKSEDKITPDSAKEFVLRMVNSGHGAMLEHGTIYLDFPAHPVNWEAFECAGSKYSFVGYEKGSQINHITTNYRVLVENDWLDLLDYQVEPSKYHEKRVMVRFTCDRGVSHELVRHRVFSFAQESTRYCNYSKDKFGGEITCIIPTWYEEASEAIKNYFSGSLQCAEDAYFTLLENGYTAQQARQVLPNALKTEVVMTGFVKDWEQFFELRCAPNAHPDMKYLADKLKEEFISRGYI